MPENRQAAAPWSNLPKGWTDASVKKFWDTLTGDVKHKVTKCIKKMEGSGMDDPGAFCASLADKVEGKEWRSRSAGHDDPTHSTMETTMPLREALIRLAHENPEMRADLLPILKTAEPRYRDYRRRYKGEGSPMSKEEWESKVLSRWRGKGKKDEKPKGKKDTAPKNDEPIKVPGGKAIGEYLGQWASGGDIFGQVGSHLYGGHPMPKAKLQEALTRIESMLGSPKEHRLEPDDVKELTKAQKALAKAVGAKPSEGSGKPAEKKPETKTETPAAKAPAKRTKPKAKRTPELKKHLDKHKLTEDDADEVLAFKKAKPPSGIPLSDAQLLQRFLQKASPETKKRMMGPPKISAADFKAMYAAIMDDEEGGEGGKQASGKEAIRPRPQKKETCKGTAGSYAEYRSCTDARFPMTEDEWKKRRRSGPEQFGVTASDQALLTRLAKLARDDESIRPILMPLLREASAKTASGPDPRGRNWKEKTSPHRWVWTAQDGPAFTVIEKEAPFGMYYKLQILLPDGSMFITHGQKDSPEQWFVRAADLFKRWGSAAGFDLSKTPERWSRMAAGHLTYDDYVRDWKKLPYPVDVKGKMLGQKEWEKLMGRSSDKKATEKTAHGPVSMRDPDTMFFYIDPKNNNSKFYEMRIVPAGKESRAQKSAGDPSTAQWVLERRWGRLTDTGATGRVDSYNEFWGDKRMAERSMMEHGRKRTGKGYEDVSRTQEYPIGLGSAGFGWGGQAACRVIPELGVLKEAMQKALAAVTAAQRQLRPIAQQDSSMAQKLSGMLEGVEGNLDAIVTYLDGQLAFCR